MVEPEAKRFKTEDGAVGANEAAARTIYVNSARLADVSVETPLKPHWSCARSRDMKVTGGAMMDQAQHQK